AGARTGRGLVWAGGLLELSHDRLCAADGGIRGADGKPGDAAVDRGARTDPGDPPEGARRGADRVPPIGDAEGGARRDERRGSVSGGAERVFGGRGVICRWRLSTSARRASEGG